MKKYIRAIMPALAFATFIFITAVAYSDPQAPTGNAGHEGPIGGSAPVDGISGLLIISVLYAIIKYRRAKVSESKDVGESE
ncbi:MAG: hypothetical protein NTW49_07740 [Bacteroidia bacterium]|nr:hypothetical protein [Bacteroidia bacterium]